MIKQGLITICTVILFLFSCSEQKTSDSGSINSSQLEDYYREYLKLKDALVASDAQSAANHARQMAEIPGDDELQQLNSIAADIAVTTDLEEQRAIFFELSDQLIDDIKRSGGKVGSAYVQHCPMAFDDSGADWISDSKQIRNPYFGDAMLKCGKVVETLSE